MLREPFASSRLRGLLLLPPGAALTLLIMTTTAMAEDGSKLWLRYAAVTDAAALDSYQRAARQIVVRGNSSTLLAAGNELHDALASLLGVDVARAVDVMADGAIVVGERDDTVAGEEGFRIRSIRVGGHAAIVVSCKSDIGALYGV